MIIIIIMLLVFSVISTSGMANFIQFSENKSSLDNIQSINNILRNEVVITKIYLPLFKKHTQKLEIDEDSKEIINQIIYLLKTKLYINYNYMKRIFLPSRPYEMEL